MSDSQSKGSLDIYFTYAPNSARRVLVEADVQGKQFSPTTGDEFGNISLQIGSHDSTLTETDVNCDVRVYIGSVLVSRFDRRIGPLVNEFRVRVYFYNNFVSVTCNEVWVGYYAFGDMVYKVDGSMLSVKANGDAFTISDINFPELNAYREAVFVDYESNSQSAIESIIQQRPIETYPSQGRANSYSYLTIRDVVDVTFVNEYQEDKIDVPDLASDALVYYSDVGIVLSPDTAEEFGLITRLYRLSELDNEAIKVSRIKLKKALEQTKKRTVSCRFDSRIDYGDIIHFNIIITGTGREFDKYIVVEGISIDLRDGSSSMTIDGRETVI